MIPQLPPGPYEYVEDPGPEPFYCKTWTVHLREQAHDGTAVCEIDAWTFTDEAETDAWADETIADPTLEHENFQYTVVVTEGLQECAEPEPDPDSAPGGHDDI